MAVPHPDEELERVRRLVGKGLPPVVAVTGSNDFYRAEALELLLAAVPKDAELIRLDATDDRGDRGEGDADDGDAAAGEADGEAAGAGETAEGLQDVPELIGLRGGGLFARAAFLCVRRGTKWWQRCAVVLAAQAPKFSPGSGVLLEAKKLDKRKKVAAALVKELADKGALFDFRDLYDTPWDPSRGAIEGEVVKWVVSRAGKLGIALTAEAALLLVAQVGKALPELLAELGRLRDQLGSDPRRKPLLPEDLRGRLTCSFESTPFEFAEAVLGGERRKALRSVRAMFDRGVRGKDGRAMSEGGLLPFATSWLYQSLAKAYEGRCLLDGGVSVRDLPARLSVFKFADRFVEQVQKNSLRQLRRGLLALHHCQRASRLTGEDPEVLLERFLAQWFDGAPIPTAEDLEL